MRISLFPFLFGLFALFFLSERKAGALAPFMDGGIFLNLEAIGTYETNLFANANEQDDFYFTFIPELQYNRTAGLLNLDVRAGFEVLRFLDFSNQNTEDLFASLALTSSNHPGGHPRQIGFDVRWRQTSSTRQTLGTRARSEILDAVLTGRSNVSDRLALRGVGSYGQERFDESSFSEINTWVVGMDGVHIYSDKLEAFLGYRYRKTETAGVTRPSLDIDDHLLHVGAEGQLTARITGLVSVGVQQRSFGNEGLDDTVKPYWTVSGTWVPRVRSEITLLASKDFSVTPDDRSVDEMTIRLVLNQGVYRGFSLEPVVSYTTKDIERQSGAGREDDRYEGGLGLIYDLAGGASTALRYSYRNQDSDNPFFDYESHIVDLSVRMTF